MAAAKSKNGNKRWYALYTRPRWEKKVNQLLSELGVETYCPLNKVHRKWSDRMKMVEEPLFKSYLFVRILENEKTPVRMTTGVVNFVYWNGRPGIVKDREIDQIRRFLNEHESVEVVPHDIRPNHTVRIQSGIFMDKEARVLKVMKKKVELVIESLGYSLVAYVDKSNISLVKRKASTGSKTLPNK